VKIAPSVVVLGLAALTGCSSGSSPRSPAPPAARADAVAPPGPSGTTSDGPGATPPSPDATAPTSLSPDAGAGSDAAVAPLPSPDAGTHPDGGAAPDGGAPPADVPLPPPLMACPGAQIDRIQQWLSWSGDSTPAPGAGGASILIKNGDSYQGKVEFRGADWHEVVVRLINSATEQTDLTGSTGFWLTYSATADLWVQLRPASDYNGGDKWVTKIPGTAGKMVTQFFPFTAASWFYINVLGMPTYPFADALKTARAFNFVGNAANVLTFAGLRVDRLTPPCR
jgi:hypothetical protein